jgi:multidrug efflux pump subunit AcrA (membrane-fusion protein)
VPTAPSPRRWLPALAALLGAALLFAPLPESAEGPARIEGVLPPHEARAPAGGLLVSPLPALGARVAQGDALAELDPAALELRLGALMVEVDALRAALSAREAVVGALGARLPGGDPALEAARAEASLVEAALARAEGEAAALGEARAELSLGSPVAGVVVAVAPRAPGDRVLAGEVLVTVMPDGPTRVVTHLPAASLRGLAVDQAATLWPADARLGRWAGAAATVEAVGGVAENGAVRVELRPAAELGPVGTPLRARVSLPARSTWDRLTGR